ncbi:MAG: hypothetical protein EBS01_14200, partial [Verrucomicrobia bacterium]|nr:hypothetical protein [Verrucomicrobiota bacterium]
GAPAGAFDGAASPASLDSPSLPELSAPLGEGVSGFLLPSDSRDADYLHPASGRDNFTVTFKAKPVPMPGAESGGPLSAPSETPLESKYSPRRFWEAAIPQAGVPGTGGGLFSGRESEYAEIARYSQMHRKGPAAYFLKLGLASVYDDNVSISNSGRTGDLQTSVGPSARVELGSGEAALRLGASYSGAASWFARAPGKRSYEQAGGLDGGWSGSRLKLGFRLGTQSTESASLDAGARVRQQTFYEGASLSYALTGKTSVELSGDASASKFEGLLGSHENRLQEFLNYDWSPKWQFGVGSTQGVLQADGAGRQTYDQALFRVIAQPYEKLGWSAAFGNEWRHFEEGGGGSRAPVFSAGLNWRATGHTLLSLDATRRTFSSASLAGQNYDATSIAVGGREILTPAVDGTVSLGFERANYRAAAPGISSEREDGFYFSRVGLNWLVGRACSLGGFYEFSSNVSTGAQQRSFQRNRIGVTFNVSF